MNKFKIAKILLITFLLSLFIHSYSFSFTKDDKIVAASFFYWYNNDTGEHLWYKKEGNYSITFYPPEMNSEGKFPGTSYKNKEWFRGQIKDMIAAGVNVIAPIIWPSENTKSWSWIGMQNLLEVMKEMKSQGYNVPKIAVFFDTSTIHIQELDRIKKETGKPVDFSDPKKSWTVDFTNEKNIERFYKNIRLTFMYITGETPETFDPEKFQPEKSKYYDLWAFQDGYPMVFIWEAGKGYFYKDWDARLFDNVITSFEKDFHIKPRLFPDYEWSLKNDRDNETPFNLNGGGYIRWRASVYEPYAMNEKIMMPLKGMDGIEFGPGYDDRNFPDRLTNGTPIRSRDNGLFFSYCWQYALRTNKNLIMLESWNELHEGTQINDTLQTSRKYINLNKYYSEKLSHDYSNDFTVFCKMRSTNKDNLSIINDEEGLYQVDGGVLKSREQPYNQKETDYLYDKPFSDGITKVYFENNKEFRRTDLPVNQFMYFDIDDKYINSKDENHCDHVFIHISYLDRGNDSFCLRLADTQTTYGIPVITKKGTDKIRWATFRVPVAALSGMLAKEINLYSYIKQGCDFAIDSMRDGDEYICEVQISKSDTIISLQIPENIFPGQIVSIPLSIIKNGESVQEYDNNIMISCADTTGTLISLSGVKFEQTKHSDKNLTFKAPKPGKYLLTLQDEKDPFIVLNNLELTVQKFRISAPEKFNRGKESQITVTALDDEGQKDSKYKGNIKFTKNSMNDSIPLNYQFSEADHGEHKFNISIGEYGKQYLYIEDSDNADLSGKIEINIPQPVVSAILNDKPVFDGLSSILPVDGNYSLSEAGGKKCWMVEKGKGNFLYFNIDDSIYFNLPRYNNKYIMIDYFDEGNGAFLVQYDSHDSYLCLPGFKTALTQTVFMTDTKKWKTAAVYLEDALFANRTNGGDFRIDPGNTDLHICKVSVLDKPGKHPELSPTAIYIKKYAAKIILNCALLILIVIVTITLIRFLRRQKKKISGVEEFAVIMLILGSCFLIYASFITKPILIGDGLEYLMMTQSFDNHFSPDLRENDIADSKKIAEKNNLYFAIPSIGFFKSKSGNLYSWHFWLYSLITLPAKEVLKILNANELKCFQITNIFLLLISSWLFIIFAKLEKVKKYFAVFLILTSPAVWYAFWPHPEVFCLSMIILSFMMFTRGRYISACFFAALASMQNPPIMFLAFIYLLYSLKEVYITFRNKKSAVLNFILSGIVFLTIALPVVFFFINFNTSNLIIKSGGAALRLVTVKKILSIFLDLNEGMIYYVPVIVLFFIFSIFKSLVTKNFKSLMFTGSVLLMAFLSAQSSNWNSGSAGVFRYAVWMMPVMLFSILLTINFSKSLNQVLLIAGVIFQFVILLSNGGVLCNINHIDFNNFSKKIMYNHPRLYNPEFEIFTERIMHKEGGNTRDLLPIVFIHKDSVTKILADYESLKTIKYDYKIKDMKYFDNILNKLEKEKDRDRIRYFNIPKRKIKVYKNREITKANMYSNDIQLISVISKMNTSVTNKLRVKIKNKSGVKWNESLMNSNNRLCVSYHWLDENMLRVAGEGIRTPLPKTLDSGEEAEFDMEIKAPDKSGKYTLEIDMLREGVSWFADRGCQSRKIIVDVE